MDCSSPTRSEPSSRARGASLLVRLEQEDVADTCKTRPGKAAALCEQAGFLRVQMAYVADGVAPGKVYLRAAGWSGFAGAVSLADWAHGVMSRHQSKARKLLAHKDAAERHMFIWATVGSDFAVHALLEQRGRDALLKQPAPSLPQGIEHLWVAGSMSTHGAVVWSVERGWWRTPWAFPANA